MTLEERIVKLFSSLQTENVIFGAKLLSSVQSLEEQLRIFLEACNISIDSGNIYSKASMVYRRIYRLNDSAMHDDWKLICTKDWMLLLSVNSRMYMLDCRKATREEIGNLASARPNDFEIIEI